MFGVKIDPVIWRLSSFNLHCWFCGKVPSRTSLRFQQGPPGMARGLTEQELDEQFQLFLQEVITQPASRGQQRSHRQSRAADVLQHNT